jgi:hypothetical protein
MSATAPQARAFRAASTRTAAARASRSIRRRGALACSTPSARTPARAICDGVYARFAKAWRRPAHSLQKKEPPAGPNPRCRTRHTTHTRARAHLEQQTCMRALRAAPRPRAHTAEPTPQHTYVCACAGGQAPWHTHIFAGTATRRRTRGCSSAAGAAHLAQAHGVREGVACVGQHVRRARRAEDVAAAAAVMAPPEEREGCVAADARSGRMVG